jgi:hypothetical protein
MPERARRDAAKAMTMVKRLTIFTIFRRTSLTAPDQFSRRVLQLLAALPRGIDRKEPHPTPKAHNRALRTRRGEEDVSNPFRPCRLRLQRRPHKRYSKTAAACHKCHPEAEEWPSFVPEAMPIMRALTPQSAQIISLSGPILKPCDRLLIVVSKFPLSFSSHVAEPFSAHSGHVTDVTDRSRLSITASRLRA